MDNWILVKDKLPKKGQKVFYYFDVVGVFAGKYNGIIDEEDVYGHHFSGENGWLVGDVTHWMPREGDELPEPPE